MKTKLRAALPIALLSGTPVANAEQAQPRAETQAPQPIPFRKDDNAGALAVNVGVALLVALGLGLGVLLLMRRYLMRGRMAPGRRLRVIETVRLTPKSALFLVQLDGRTLLIGQQGETLTVLAPPLAAEGGTSPLADHAP